jgi:hypothetical protein
MLKEKHDENPVFYGPVTKRRSTDIFFLILFIVTILVMNLVGLMGTGVIHSERIKKGNPWRLLRGMDYRGNICGIDDGVKGRHNKWIPDSTSNAKKNYNFLSSGFGESHKLCVKI